MNKNTFEQKMAQLFFLRQRKRSKRNRALRKKRNKQLFAFGVLVEEAFKAGTVEERPVWIESAHGLLTGRNLGLVLEGFARLSRSRKGRE